MGLEPGEVDDVLGRLLTALERRLDQPAPVLLDALRDRDALAGRRVAWAGGTGVAEGIDASGALRVRVGATTVSLDAGEVHLLP
jgi:biotin-(acetyl-CoA carboxylase) ligase